MSEQELEKVIERVIRKTLAETTSEYLTTEAATELLGVSRNTFNELIKSGGLPVHRLGARTIRIVRSELLEWVKSRDAA